MVIKKMNFSTVVNKFEINFSTVVNEFEMDFGTVAFSSQLNTKISNYISRQKWVSCAWGATNFRTTGTQDSSNYNNTIMIFLTGN